MIIESPQTLKRTKRAYDILKSTLEMARDDIFNIPDDEMRDGKIKEINVEIKECDSFIDSLDFEIQKH